MKKKKVVALALAAAMVMSLAACGNNGGKEEEKGGEATDVTIDQITLGEDYTDLEADLKFLTHKTDSSRRCIRTSILSMKESQIMQMM